MYTVRSYSIRVPLFLHIQIKCKNIPSSINERQCLLLPTANKEKMKIKSEYKTNNSYKRKIFHPSLVGQFVIFRYTSSHYITGEYKENIKIYKSINCLINRDHYNFMVVFLDLHTRKTTSEQSTKSPKFHNNILLH